MQTITLALL